ncbi:MAG: substrate-binding domain-containing protein, partial [Planctomycetes bacterium]|nr:substrate-binding domain-containing protein [Planctomycetota bacterium]
PPPVIAGSHDPLLEWAVRESGCGLALMFDGSLDGLARLGAGQALAAGMHVPDGSGGWNLHEVTGIALPAPVVVIEWAWREQGLVTAQGNPKGIRGIADLARPGVRVIGRQRGAGSRALLEALLAAEGLDATALTMVDPPARSESDVALAVLSGKADAGLGIRSTVTALNLDFLPLARERYDLVVGRRDWFEPALQALARFTTTPAFAARAADLGGYDIDGRGAVRWNSPAP